eukprot:UN26524
MSVYGTTFCYWMGIDHQILRIIVGVSLFMSTFNLLYYLRASDEVSLVVIIMGNIFQYLVLHVDLNHIVVGIQFGVYVLNTDDSFYGFFDVFLFTFRMGVLAKVLFVGLQICSTITMLNALISHMGDIYDKVREKSLGYQSYERIKL